MVADLAYDVCSKEQPFPASLIFKPRRAPCCVIAILKRLEGLLQQFAFEERLGFACARHVLLQGDFVRHRTLPPTPASPPLVPADASAHRGSSASRSQPCPSYARARHGPSADAAPRPSRRHPAALTACPVQP